MKITNFVILPLVGMLIGLFTNWIAIKLLFWPKREVLGIKGVIPKRKEKIAEKIAESSLKILPKKIEKLSKFPYIGKKITNYIKKEVSKKVKSLDNQELEEIVEKTARKEFQFIKLSGAFLGFIIGLIQAIILELI